MYMTVQLGLGDPHHHPFDENPEYAKEILRQTFELLGQYAPGAEWRLIIGEDIEIEVDITDEAFEALKADERSSPEGDDWFLEGEITGSDGLSARVASRSHAKHIVAEDKTLRGVLVTIARTGWFGAVAKTIAGGDDA